ncbi:ribonucleases P/MRP protein subunit POP1-domain-containing protein [Biscogniauxia mediterranea]|nr:ribonucleases P/MRP protein subunit POP1-domain-containing protein [Biscogniauxia mediterranea]
MPPQNAPQGTPAGKPIERSNAAKKPLGSSWVNPTQSREQRKRKNTPHQGTSSNSKSGKNTPLDTRATKRMKTSDTRAIAVQKSHAALKDGELDVQAFVNSMAFEINALDESMRRTRTSKTSRAFQRVPFRMRRRAAAHNYRRVPKRLQKRAKREMIDDNTPTVSAKTRKPKTTRARLRAQTARRLEILAKRKRLLKLKKGLGDDKETITIRAARPKIRRNALNDAPLTAPRYRKRQREKIWLPTHLWHAKRARMTSPAQPLWGWAVPITPTQKVYRPTHRAQWERGAMAWDMSYMSTIGMSGSQGSMQSVLKLLGLTQEALWNDTAKRWRAGAIHWSGHLSRRIRDTVHVIGPATIIWNPEKEQHNKTNSAKAYRQLFIRIHPSAFLETFNELLRLVKMQNPRPYLQDLRYEIGSIDITGPDSTEVLLGVLKPYVSKDIPREADATMFESLVGLKDPASLPHGSLLAFSISDPRLRYPPRQVPISQLGSQSSHTTLLDALSAFRRDEGLSPRQLFDRDARFKASRLPSQQSLNRRRGKGPPGTVLEPTVADPPIPIMLLASRNSTKSQTSGTWTLMLPWKCVLPVWYSLMHYPVSTGGNPWFGGLNEIRQLKFEHGQPWFPGDFPGTEAGNKWELEERNARKKAWDSMPKGKRVNWETLDLGAGRKGEIGVGWNCDYEKLFGLRPTKEPTQKSSRGEDMEDTSKASAPQESQELPVNPLAEIIHLPTTAFNSYQTRADELPVASVVTVNIKILGRGVPTACARIYRLPEAKTADVSTQAEVPATDPPLPKVPGKLPPNLRDQWLSQNQPKNNTNQNNISKIRDREARKQLLAQQLSAPVSSHALASPTSENINGYPLCPNEDDLIGFVTNGSFSLRDGRGEGIGSLSAAKAMKELRAFKKPNNPAARLCIVRNAGQNIGWLARWELI